MSVSVVRLNHAVLYVREIDRSVAFYEAAFGFEVVAREAGGRAAFLRAGGGTNHHDLGLFAVGMDAAGPEGGRVGLYHLAWQVATIDDLADAAMTLQRLGAFTGVADHGATKSLYGKDPDGNEFEVMWMLPREHWGEHEHSAVVQPLDITAEVARWTGARTA